MLQEHPTFKGCPGPVVLVVMDGIGLSDRTDGNAVHHAYTPTLDRLLADYPHLTLQAHGTAVGLPTDGDMGNSEVGHNAIGAGQVYSQGAKLVNESIATGQLFERDPWREVVGNCTANESTLHFLGLFSDGNVHSHLDHLRALIEHAKRDGVTRVRIHILLDGRDVGERSALEYVDPFETFLAELRDEEFDARIASGGGRMQVTMDRYESDWKIVEIGWQTHVAGELEPWVLERFDIEEYRFKSARAAIVSYRDQLGVIDQDLPPFVVVDDDDTPLGPICDGDSVVYFNFRGDRAIEISRAFDTDDFGAFERRPNPSVVYAGMLEYDGDEHIPSRYLVDPPTIHDTLGEHLAASGVTQLAISETQKYGHVTYFWNGNRTGKFDTELETYIEIPSDRVPFEQRPWMKAAEITDELLARLKSGEYRFARLNFANGDMVGHTGHFQAARVAVETVDLCLGRLLPAVDRLGGLVIITADHGNADEMYELSKRGEVQRDERGRPRPKTSHTLNPVPCIFYDKSCSDAYTLVGDECGYGLANLAATVANLLGYEKLASWEPSMLRFDDEEPCSA